MQGKLLPTATLLFFLLVNTFYFWEGVWSFYFCVVLFVYFVALALVLLAQLGFAWPERFKNRRRVYSMAFTGAVLALTVWRPTGLIDYEKLEGENILIADRQVSAFYSSTLHLKSTGKFCYHEYCFGKYTTVGRYTMSHDTVFLNPAPGSKPQLSFKFGILNDPPLNTHQRSVNMYISAENGVPFPLWISKNELGNRQ